MINAWIESVFLKRVLLAMVAGTVAGVTSHLLPWVNPFLAHYGMALNVTDPAKLQEGLTVSFMAVSQGVHEWVAAKYPDLAKWI